MVLLHSNRNSGRLRMETIREQSESLDHLPVTSDPSKLTPPSSGEDVSSGRGSVVDEDDLANEFTRLKCNSTVSSRSSSSLGSNTLDAGEPCLDNTELDNEDDDDEDSQDDCTEETALILDCCNSCNGQIRFIEMKGNH